jgi:LacI family repressor for deo operon, udp, cdd, tsx, nupC, and nupG
VRGSSTTSTEVNMADVARRAGVSIATVSRALRDVPGVSDATRLRIREIADELSYVVSPEASGLARRETGRVAVVVPRIDIWFYATMLASVERVLRAADLDVLVYQVDGEEERGRFFEQLPARRKVDAAVLIALPLREREVDRLDLLGVEVVVAGGRLRDHPCVEVDDHEIALTAMRHLLDLGHRRIGMIRTSDTVLAEHSSELERSRGYYEALEQAGIELREEYLVTMPFGLEAGGRGMERLLALPDPPTAVFAFTDEVALSALRTLVGRGIDIPGGMSVIGVDDHPHAELIGLTTVAQDIAELGRLSAVMAVRLLRGEGLEQRTVVVPSRLIVRGTTAPPHDRQP